MDGTHVVPPLNLSVTSPSLSSPGTASLNPLAVVREVEEFPKWLVGRERFRKELGKRFDGAEDEGAGMGGTGMGGTGEGEGDLVDLSPGGTTRPVITSDLSHAALDVILAMRAPVKERVRKDSLTVYRFLLEQPFFLDIDRRKVEILSELVSYVYYPQGASIIRQGDIGDYFYMIIHGTVEISVNGVGVVDTMSEPASFGDLALTSDEARQANVEAATDCHLVRLSRRDFNDTIHDWRERQNEDICDFLARLPMFAKWSKTRLLRLVPRIQVKNPRVGDHVVTQGKTPFAVYILRKGSLAVRHSIAHPHENYWPASNEAVEGALEYAELVGLKRNVKNTVRIAEPEPEGEAKEGGGGEGGGAGAGQGPASKASAPSGDAALAAGGAGGNPTQPGGGGGDATGATTGVMSSPAPLSRARQLAAMAKETGISFLPFPVERVHPKEEEAQKKPWGSPRQPSHLTTLRATTTLGGLAEASPPPRERGWGAGNPGGTLAYSPGRGKGGSSSSSSSSSSSLKKSALQNRGTAAASPEKTSSSSHGTVYLDSSRALPTAVRFVVNSREDIVGKVEVGGVFGLQECLRGTPSPFTYEVDSPGCTVLYFSKKYLDLVPSEDSLKFGAPPNPLLSTILADGASPHIVKNLASLGVVLGEAQRRRVAQELLAEAAFAREVSLNPKLKTSSVSVRGSAKKVAETAASRDPAILVSLLPMNSEEVQRVIWNMVSRLADEVYSSRHGRQGGDTPRTPATPVKSPPPHGFKESRIATTLFARAAETGGSSEPPPALTIPR